MKDLLKESLILPSREVSQVKIGEAQASDRSAIKMILEASGVFSEEEVSCGLSLFDEYLRKGVDPQEYVFYCAYDSRDEVKGLICFGRASLTDRVYDLYWIATDIHCQGQGIGGLLMRALDQELKRLKARMVLAETSSKAHYIKARSFYLKQGYRPISTIKDYYALGDDLVVFQKQFDL